MNKFHLNNIRLRDKLLLMYILSVFLPILMTNVIFYNVTVTNIKNQKIRDAKLALENIKGSLEGVIDQAAGVAYSFYVDRTFNEYISRRYNSTYEYVDVYNSYLKDSFANSDKNMQNALQYKVYTDNPTILSGYIDRLTEDVRSSSWYTQYKSYGIHAPTLIKSKETFSLIQKLDNYYTNGFTQILKIDLNLRTIHQLFQNNAFDGKVYLVDPMGRVQFSNDGGIEWSQKIVMFEDIPRLPNWEGFEALYTGSKYLEGWMLYGNMNKNMVLQEVRKSRYSMVWLACINFVVPSIIIAALSRSLHVRLVRLLKYMKMVKNQKFQTIKQEEGRDEIGQLTKEFNRMTLKMDSLINDVYLADIQKKNLELKQQKAQLHALYSQINPHFLFNALESIRMRSVIKEEEETAQIIYNLALMFRRSISWSREWITVREELEVIRCFLEIQKYRFDDQLEFEIRVDEQAMDYMIPRMSFLPFVENASVHGIESVPEKGNIRVYIDMEAGGLKVTVEDNGRGMSPSKLEEIKLYLAMDDGIGERVGIKNTYYRLKLIYQDRFSFNIQSEEGEGTSIQILLPLMTREQLGDMF